MLKATPSRIPWPLNKLKTKNRKNKVKTLRVEKRNRFYLFKD